jgi:enoyl-CoA hydratase
VKGEETLRKSAAVELEQTGDLALSLDVQAGVGIVMLDRARVLNALSTSSLVALEAAIDRCETEPSIRVLVIGGRGRAFCTGADIKEQAGFDAAASDRFVALGQRVFGRLQSGSFVSIAALHGYVLGGGLELAMSCDLRIASPDTSLGQPEVGLGHIPGWGGTQLLPRLVGRSRALDMLITGDRISADEALAIGLVDDVVGEGEAQERAEGLARRYATSLIEPVRAIKGAMYAGATLGYQAGLLAERSGVARCRESADNAIRLRSFGGSSDPDGAP